MFTVEESIVINKPRFEVWAFMADPDNVPSTAATLSITSWSPERSRRSAGSADGSSRWLGGGSK